jgi:hypothetical protein
MSDDDVEFLPKGSSSGAPHPKVAGTLSHRVPSTNDDADEMVFEDVHLRSRARWNQTLSKTLTRKIYVGGNLYPTTTTW